MGITLFIIKIIPTYFILTEKNSYEGRINIKRFK